MAKKDELNFENEGAATPNSEKLKALQAAMDKAVELIGAALR